MRRLLVPDIDPADIVPIRDLPREQVLRAFGLLRQGKVIDLSVPRVRGMPLFPGHPAFEVHSFQTPRGLRVDKPSVPHNDISVSAICRRSCPGRCTPDNMPFAGIAFVWFIATACWVRTYPTWLRA